VFAGALWAQDCKARFAVAYSDGKLVQPGLTQEQRKYWDKDGRKKFKGMCLDLAKPDYVILWSVGVSGKELAQVAVANFNRNQDTGESTTATRQTYWSKTSTSDDRSLNAAVYLRDWSGIRGKAEYRILDLSKNPAATIREGQGYQDVPGGIRTRAGQGEKVDTADLASTIPDPVAAMENALKWLRKEKKL
jgi:hypothetical protein